MLPTTIPLVHLELVRGFARTIGQLILGQPIIRFAEELASGIIAIIIVKFVLLLIQLFISAIDKGFGQFTLKVIVEPIVEFVLV